MLKKLSIGLALSASFFISGNVVAEAKVEESKDDFAFVPFYFSTESLGSSFGVAGIKKGVGQPQAALFGMGMYTTKSSYITFLSGFNYALSPYLLASAQLYQAKLNDSFYFIGEAGGNDSKYDDLTETNGFEQRYSADFRLLLPWGSVADDGLIGAVKPHRSVSTASPIDSGVTSVTITPFYSFRELDANDYDERALGLTVNFDWDNRDNTANTTEGSHTSFKLTTGSEDWGDVQPWLKWEFQNSQYFALGNLGDWFDQQVLAFDFYLADTPTWDRCEDGICQRPPEQEQAKLGGLYRLRSSVGGRYHDRSAIHYSAEYRVIPDWQPLDDIPVLNYYYDIPWWQWVAFAEVGRVADEFDLNTLHQDMKWNLGGAVRFQVEGVVVRTEIAKGDEENTFRVMINQPF